MFESFLFCIVNYPIPVNVCVQAFINRTSVFISLGLKLLDHVVNLAYLWLTLRLSFKVTRTVKVFCPLYKEYPLWLHSCQCLFLVYSHPSRREVVFI